MKKVLTILLLLSSNNMICNGQDAIEKYLVQKKKYENLLKLPQSLRRDTSMIIALDSILFFSNRFYLKNFDYYNSKMFQLLSKTEWKKAKAIVNLYKGLALGHGGEPIKSVELLEQAEKQFEIFNDFARQSYTLIKMGYIISKHSNLTKSIFLINRGIEIAKKIKNKNLILLGLNHKGNIYLNLKDYKPALADFEEYDLANDPDLDNYWANKLNIGVCLLNLNQEKKALDYILTAFDKIPTKTNHQKYLHTDISEILVKYYLNKNDFENASRYLEYTKKYYIFDKTQLFYYDFQIFHRRGNYKEALNSLIKFRDLELSKKQVEEKNSLEGIKSQLALKEQNEKLQKSELEKLRLQTERQNQFRWLFLALSIIGLLTTIYIFRTNKKLKKNNQELLAKNAEISAALLQGQTIERKRVAADLHDSLGSTMSSLIYTVNAIDTNNLKNVYRHLKQMLDTAYNEIRLLSHNLLPEEFEKQGLAEALRHFVRKINQTKTIQFDLSIDPQLGRLSPKTEFELYSICLELINNILKHSKATQAQINLSKITPPLGAGGLLLVIADNGRGFFNNDSDGKGMKNVKARVESLNGTWKYDSKPNIGTSSTISIPL